MKKTIILSLFLFLQPLFFYCQQSKDESNYYIWFDELVGVENTGLYLGTEYLINYRITEENYSFFESQNFLLGTVNYNRQTYFNQEIKYNIYEDEVIIKLQNNNGQTIMKLIKDKLDGFTINNHVFINIQGADEYDTEVSGFFEIITKNSFFTLYKKHRKRKIKKLDKRIIYYEYKDRKNQYYLFYNKIYINIKTKRDFSKIFPEFKKDLMDIRQNVKSKSNQDILMISLSNRVFQLMSK